MLDIKCLLGCISIAVLLFCGLPYFAYRLSMAAAIGWHRGIKKHYETLDPKEKRGHY